jgi:phage terminase large subunit
METLTPRIRPTPKQELAWEKLQDDITRFLLIGGGAGGSKTWLYCEWLLVWAYFYPGSRGFMARNELRDCPLAQILPFAYIRHRVARPSGELSLTREPKERKKGGAGLVSH